MFIETSFIKFSTISILLIDIEKRRHVGQYIRHTERFVCVPSSRTDGTTTQEKKNKAKKRRKDKTSLHGKLVYTFNPRRHGANGIGLSLARERRKPRRDGR